MPGRLVWERYLFRAAVYKQAPGTRRVDPKVVAYGRADEVTFDECGVLDIWALLRDPMELQHDGRRLDGKQGITVNLAQYWAACGKKNQMWSGRYPPWDLKGNRYL